MKERRIKFAQAGEQFVPMLQPWACLYTPAPGANVPLAGLQHSAAWGGGEGRERGGGAAPGVSVAPLVLFPGGGRGWLEGLGPQPPYGRLCGAAHPPLQRARPGLRGVPRCQARPGGLAAGWSVPAVALTHVPCGRPGGGALCVLPSLGVVAGGPRGGGGRVVALPRSVPLPPLCGHQSGLYWRRSVHGGCGLHTALVRVCALPPGRGPRGALACRCRTAGLSRSLWECAGDSFGARGVWAWWRSPSGAAALLGGGGGAPLARQRAYRANVGRPPAYRGLGRGEGREGGGSRRGSPSPPFGPLVLFSGRSAGWLEGPGPGPPYGRQCSAARPSLQSVRPVLFGIPWRRARPGGLAAGGSVPAVTTAHALCQSPGGGGGEDGGGGLRFWGFAPGGGAPQAAGPNSPPALLPATGRLAVVSAFAHGPPAPRVAAASSRGTGGGRRVRRAPRAVARVSG